MAKRTPSTDFNRGAGLAAINEMRVDARTAMANGDDAEAVRVIKAFEDFVPPTSDTRRQVYNNFMHDAIAYGSKGAIDYLFGKSQTHYASGIAHASQIDQLDSFNHFIAKAKAEGDVIEQIDLQMALVFAAEHGSSNVLSAALDLGVDPKFQDNRALWKALEKYSNGEFGIIEKLLRHGADFEIARDFAKEHHPHDSVLAEKIAAVQQSMKAEQDSIAAKAHAEKVETLSIIGKGSGRDVVAPERATFRPRPR